MFFYICRALPIYWSYDKEWKRKQTFITISQIYTKYFRNERMKYKAVNAFVSKNLIGENRILFLIKLKISNCKGWDQVSDKKKIWMFYYETLMILLWILNGIWKNSNTSCHDNWNEVPTKFLIQWFFLFSKWYLWFILWEIWGNCLWTSESNILSCIFHKSNLWMVHSSAVLFYVLLYQSKLKNEKWNITRENSKTI